LLSNGVGDHLTAFWSGASSLLACLVILLATRLPQQAKKMDAAMNATCSTANIEVTNPLIPSSILEDMKAISGNPAAMNPKAVPMMIGFSFMKYPRGHASRNAQIAAPLAPPAESQAPMIIRVRGSLEANGM
jgi:hypothetical protein